jgi:chromosome partitioning protein
MIKSIAFHILKGGVGKSTLSGNIGYCVSQKTKKTILIDCDVQGSLSNWLIKDDVKYDYELSDVLQGKIEIKKAIIQIRDNLYIIPTKKENSEIEAYSEVKLIKEPYIFEDVNIELDKAGFEYAIYDLAPSISQLERCVLLSCNEVCSPMTAEYFSIDGLKLFYGELQKINKAYRKNVKYDKIIINNINNSFDTHKKYIKALSSLQDQNYIIYKIGQDRKIADSQIYNQTIFEYYPKSQSIQELEKITMDLLK